MFIFLSVNKMKIFKERLFQIKIYKYLYFVITNCFVMNKTIFLVQRLLNHIQ